MLGPILRFRKILELLLKIPSRRIAELYVFVRRPSDPGFNQRNLLRAVQPVEPELVAEEGVRDRAARRDRSLRVVRLDVSERLAIARDDVGKDAEQLIIVPRLNVTPMVLIEIR